MGARRNNRDQTNRARPLLKTNCFYYNFILFLIKTIFIDPPRIKTLELHKLLTILVMTALHISCIYLLELIPKPNVSDHTWAKDVSMRASKCARCLLVFFKLQPVSPPGNINTDESPIMFLTCAVAIEA